MRVKTRSKLDMRSFGMSLIAELFQIGVTSDYLMSSIDLDIMMHLNILNLVSAGAECPQHQVSSGELDGANRIFWEWTQHTKTIICRGSSEQVYECMRTALKCQKS